MQRINELHRKLGMLALLVQLSAGAGWVSGYPLTDAQKHRLEQFLPQTLQKLERQMPIHVAVVGDEIAGMSTLDERNGNLFYSLHGFFLQGIEREFFYTGGVKWLNPGELPSKLQSHRGNEITVETFTAEGATALHALQALTTRVFLRHTDLVLLQVGLNDYRNGTLFDTLSRSVAHSLAICKAQGAEVVIVGPAPLRQGDALRDWGGIRQVSAELQRAAGELGIMYLDPAQELMRTHPAAGEVGLEEKTLQLASALRMDLLDYGPGKTENARINARAHKRAGQGIFKQFLNGLPESPLRIGAQATRSGSGQMTLDVVLENSGAAEQAGLLAPLMAGGDWVPEKAAEAVSLKPGQKANLSFNYQRRKAAAEETPAWDRVMWASYCFPFLFSGLDETMLLEQAVQPGPVAVRWNYTSLRGVEKGFPLTFTLCNPSPNPVRGSYEITYDRQRAKGNFQVDGNSDRDYTAQCVLPASGDQSRRRDTVVLKITSGEVTFEERRGLEATRNLILGQKVALARGDRYGNEGSDGRVDGGVTMEVGADKESLWASFELGDPPLEQGPELPALLLELTLDARPQEERHAFGFVSPIRLAFGAQPGAAAVGPIEPACFGNFYGKILSEAGIKGQLGIREDGSGKTVMVRVPRIYLYRHEWKLGSPECTLGFAARLRLLRLDPVQGRGDYPLSQDWLTASAEFGPWHAEGLAGLELSASPSPRWSVRLY